MYKFFRMLITVVVVLVAVLAGLWLWKYYLYTPWTRDGRIHADVVTVAPDVSGWVTDVNIKDGDFVKKGEILFKINDARYKAAYDKAKAIVAQREADLKLKEKMVIRRKQVSSEAISIENLDTAVINYEIAKAMLNQARADLETARLDLERTAIVSPVDGYIINLQLEKGNYVKTGNPVMAIVKDNSYYLIGYFEETKMEHIHIKDPAKIILMNGNITLYGHVQAIYRGISDINTLPNTQLLPQVQPTFDWVRLAQRIPVIISIEEIKDDTVLSVGMTATVHILENKVN